MKNQTVIVCGNLTLGRIVSLLAVEMPHEIFLKIEHFSGTHYRIETNLYNVVSKINEAPGRLDQDYCWQDHESDRPKFPHVYFQK